MIKNPSEIEGLNLAGGAIKNKPCLGKSIFFAEGKDWRAKV
jgi:hypothetical protein